MIPLTAMVTGKGTVSFKIKGRYGRGSRPSSFTSILRPVVFWNITYKCNLKCKHCYINAGDPNLIKRELPVEKTIEIADQIIKHKIPLVVFTGGEPLVSEKFWRIAEYMVSRGYTRISVSTNGTIIDWETAQRLKSLGVRYVGISLDSLKPEKHDEFRGVKGAWEKSVEGMRNSVKAGLPTGLRVTVTRGNISEVPDMIDFAASLGLERVSIYLLDTTGRAANELELLPSPARLREMIDRLIEKAIEYQDVLEILLVRMNFAGIYIAYRIANSREEFLELLKIIGAQGDCGRKTISIYPDGTVRPCQFLEAIVVGDLRREGLTDILSPDNPRLKPFFNIPERLRGERCSKCPFKHVCGGGSRNRALSASGDFWGDDPSCFFDPMKIAEKWGVNGGEIRSIIR